MLRCRWLTAVRLRERWRIMLSSERLRVREGRLARVGAAKTGAV